MMGKIQVWYDGVMMGLVSEKEAEEMVKGGGMAMGWKAYD